MPVAHRTTDSASPVRSLEIVFPQERDVDEWAARHAEGLVPSRWPYGLDHLATPGVPLRHSGAPRGSRAQRLRRELRSRVGPPDTTGRAVVTWDENTYARIAPLARGVRTYPGVIWLTDADRGSAATRRRATLLRRADTVWCTSSAQVEPLRELMGRGGPPVEFVTFGIDVDFYSPTPYPERPVVVSIGGDRDRDTRTLFDALARVAAAVPEAEIVVQAKTDLRPPEGVRLVRHLSHVELRELYRRMSVMVLATRPNLHVSGLTVSLESMATGRPVVITRTPGMEDYLRDGVAAALVDDAAGLADRAISLLRDPDTAARWGRDGREIVERSFTTHHLCHDLRRVVLGPSTVHSLGRAGESSA